MEIKRVSERTLLCQTEVKCTIGSEDFNIGNIELVLTYRKPKDDNIIYKLTSKSYTKLFNKISGHYGVKVRDIMLHYRTIKTDDESVLVIPYHCRIMTNLKAERRNKLKVILGD